MGGRIARASSDLAASTQSPRETPAPAALPPRKTRSGSASRAAASRAAKPRSYWGMPVGQRLTERTSGAGAVRARRSAGAPAWLARTRRPYYMSPDSFPEGAPLPVLNGQEGNFLAAVGQCDPGAECPGEAPRGGASQLLHHVVDDTQDLLRVPPQQIPERRPEEADNYAGRAFPRPPS